MACSHLEYSTLVLSVQVVDTIFWFWFVHVIVHDSASVTVFPSVKPYILEFISDDLFGSTEVAGLVNLFFL